MYYYNKAYYGVLVEFIACSVSARQVLGQKTASQIDSPKQQPKARAKVGAKRQCKNLN